MTDLANMATGTVKAPKRAIAEHTLLDAAGNVVETMEEAHGIGYKDLVSNLSTRFIPTNPDAIRMLAVFGAKTVATNNASQVRQKDGDANDEIEAINEGFEYMESGKGWRDDSREGPRWDVATLASAAVNVLIADKKLDAAKKDAAYAKFFEQMSQDGEDGEKAVKRVRGTAGVEAEYRKLKGKVGGSTDDMLSMIAD